MVCKDAQVSSSCGGGDKTPEDLELLRWVAPSQHISEEKTEG
jgi:hypothetical protein